MDERKYEGALKRAKELLDNMDKGDYFASKADIENIFPELKENENEDEYIRQRIIHALRGDVLDMEETIKGITWLEKQKVTDEEIIFRPIAGTDIRIAAKQALEKTNIGKKVVLAFNGAYISVNGKTVGEIDSEYDAWLKKQSEQKSADKITPKFKVGDWIVFNGLILHIDEIVNGYYRTTSRGDGIHNSYDWNIDNAARLWTIQEADSNVKLNVELLIEVLIKHLYTCVNKTNTYVRSEEDHISLSELINKIRADLIID